jgi:predicted nucleotidyltransferase
MDMLRQAERDTMTTSDADMQGKRLEGLTPAAARAFDIFERAVRQSYGNLVLKTVLFGSRARGDAGPESDVDVAVVLDQITDRSEDRNRLADLAYEAIVETYVDVHAIPVSRAEWENPKLHSNPALIRTIKTGQPAGGIEARSEAVRFAVANTAVAGGCVVPETEAILDGWARGDIDDEEMMERTLRTFGPNRSLGR